MGVPPSENLTTAVASDAPLPKESNIESRFAQFGTNDAALLQDISLWGELSTVLTPLPFGGRTWRWSMNRTVAALPEDIGGDG